MSTVAFVALGLVLCQAMLTSTHAAVRHARRGPLRDRAATDRDARSALELADAPVRLEAATRASAVLTAIVAGHAGLEPLAASLTPALLATGLPAAAASGAAIVLALVALGFALAALGDWLPRRWASVRADAWAPRLARSTRWLIAAGAAPAALLEALLARVARTPRSVAEPGPELSEAEIRNLVAEGVEAGVIDRHERDMVNRVLDLDERTVASLMHPRHAIVWLDATAPLADNLAVMRKMPYSRYPVMRGGEHDVIGVLQVKSLAEALASGRPGDLFGHLAPAIFVPESAPALSLLSRFKDAEAPLALVVDEFGDIVGLATPNDLLNAVFGRLAHSTGGGRTPIVQAPDGSWLVDGRVPIDDLREALGLTHPIRDGEEAYHTAAGFVIEELGRIPAVGERFDLAGWRFEVLELEGARIERLRIERPRADRADAPT